MDVEYTVGRQLRRRRDVVIGRMPIMLRSNSCVLNNATDGELVACNECPLDPGGYFVVRGTEKVILIQEQLSKNRMLVEKDPDGDVTVFVTSTDAERKTMTKLKHKKGIFLLAHSIFEKPVNLSIVFKALGIESDQVCVAPPPHHVRLSLFEVGQGALRISSHRGVACILGWSKRSHCDFCAEQKFCAGALPAGGRERAILCAAAAHPARRSL